MHPLNQFPDPTDLLWLFEAEPSRLDPEGVWYYDTLTYVTRRGEDVIECVLSPAYGEVALVWSRDGRELLNLVWSGVRLLRVFHRDEREGFELFWKGEAGEAAATVTLKPLVHVAGAVGESA